MKLDKQGGVIFLEKDTRSVPLQGELSTTKQQLLRWASRFPYFAFYDNCEQATDQHGAYELLIGVGQTYAPTIERWQDLPDHPEQWLMGLFPYELKNILEPHLHSQHQAWVQWPELSLFVPETVLYIPRGGRTLYVEGKHPDLENLLARPPAWESDTPPHLPFKPTVSPPQYLSTIEQFKERIEAGDFYEINLSQAFLAEGNIPEPARLYWELTRISPVPFAGMFRFEDRYILCASPERFLQLKDRQLLTQPMKGTAPRAPEPAEDLAHYQQLAQSEKERAENVMIVDLSRNDLYRSSEINSVQVPSLFEIQPFPKVWQMISTVIGRKRADVPWHQAIGHAFPPGSMTGAPKVKTMEVIDEVEPLARGAYAGSLGYVKPGGDFDLNVIIRSMVYDASAEKLAYHVGGAITYDSDPEAEYQETLLKARAIRELLEG
ncbi:MAG: anthranilate synthase component I family protein [Bacteroidota bacterium]